MTPEERQHLMDFVVRSHADSAVRMDQIEDNLRRLEGNLHRLEESQQRTQIQLETGFYEVDLRLKKLTEFQAVLMESQNDTWKAIRDLAQSLRSGGPNGQTN